MALTQTARERLAGLFKQHQDEIVQRWIDKVAGSLRGRLTRGELSRESDELFAALRGLLDTSGDLQSQDAAELRATLAELSAARARRGFSATETAISVFALKECVAPSYGRPDDDYTAFTQLVDDMGLYTFETYTQAREELISQQTEQLLELATPVVKLWEGVVAVPLVGTLDSARAQVVMEKLLQTLVETGSAHAIIDITGVPAVDTQVAQHILKTVVAARLMGADCIVSGIRPQIAQTIVALGIEFGDIATKATLADALRHALRRTGVDLVRAPVRRES
ncbi:MAG TPA: STAS domain-containing protein [Micromonosporaceae bacterium]